MSFKEYLENYTVLNEAIKYDFYKEFADSMSSYLKINSKVILPWLKKHYKDEMEVVGIVSVHMSKNPKKVSDAILSDEKI